jgi:Putative peptidoglycan binding domain
VPKKIRDDEEMPRRRRRGAAAAIEDERGLAMRIFLYSPKDMIAGLLAFAACSAVITNALFLQHGQHPAPMFSSVVAIPASQPASPLPRPRPAEADAASSEPRLAEPKLAEPKLIDPKGSDPLANLVKSTTAAPLSSTPMAPPPPANVARPSAPIPPQPILSAAARRVAAVQRALTEYGYGQLKPTGTIGPDTQAAIGKFERERRLPVTGQMSDRLVRELAAVIGHPIE